MKKIFTLMMASFIACWSFGQNTACNHGSLPGGIPAPNFSTTVNRTDVRGLSETGQGTDARYMQQKSAAVMQQLNSFLFQDYDAAGSQWINHSLDEFTYDLNGNNLTDYTSIWDITTGEFKPQFRQDRSFDANGKITTEVFSSWDSTVYEWDNTYKSEFTYAEDGLQIIETRYSWSGTLNQWGLFLQFVRNFQPNRLLTEETSLYWDGTDSVWVNSAMRVYSYNEFGYPTLTIKSLWNNTNNAWDNFSRTEYTVNPGGSVAMELLSYWAMLPGEWVNSSKIDNTYDGNGLLNLAISSVWDAGAAQWVNLYRIEYIIDVNLNTTASETYNWNANEWVPGQRNEYSYNNDFTIDDLILPWGYQQGGESVRNNFQHMLTEVIGYEGNPEVPAWKNTFNYTLLEFTNVRENKAGSVTVFPQPAREEIAFSWGNTQKFLDLKVYDINGRLVAGRRIENKSMIPVTDLMPGLYLYKLTGNAGEMFTGKLSIE